MIDCRECKYADRGFHDNTFCTRVKPVRSIDWMRDDYHGECKREGKLFEPRETKELERWVPY